MGPTGTHYGRVPKQSLLKSTSSLILYIDFTISHVRHVLMTLFTKHALFISRNSSIRAVVRTYLIDNMNCKVQEHYNGTFNFVHLTHKSPSTVRHFLSALLPPLIFEDAD